MNNTAAATILTMVLFSMLTLTFSVELSEAEGLIYIRSDGTTDPPTAPIQRDREMYTFTDDISESIILQKNNTVVDGNGYTLEGDGIGYGFDLSNTENITIKNTKISNFSAGIRLYYSTDTTLINNTVKKCAYGILLSKSPYSKISNNAIESNYLDGIFLTFSDGSIINDNVILNHSKWGLYLGSSTGIILRNNQIVGSRWNFGVSENFVHDIDASNSVDGKPIYYWVNQRDKQVPANAGYVAVVSSANIIVRNLNLTKNGQGVVLVNSENCFVEYSNITKMGYYAIQLVDSSSNIIRKNNIMDNRRPYSGVGVAVEGHSTGNIISNNLIQNNEKGILFHGSSANTIYHNNFVGNAVQASNYGSTNVWDAGYPSGGNYWSDYAGADDKNGTDQDKPGKDGIGDEPYVIDETNRDNYPFVSMVPEIGMETSINVDLIWVSAGIATVIAVAVLVYFIRTRIHVKKKPKIESGGFRKEE